MAMSKDEVLELAAQIADGYANNPNCQDARADWWAEQIAEDIRALKSSICDNEEADDEQETDPHVASGIIDIGTLSWDEPKTAGTTLAVIDPGEQRKGIFPPDED